MEDVSIGIDIGGSHVAIGVVDSLGKIIKQHEKDFTVKEKEHLIDVAIEYIGKIISELKQKYQFSKIGLGIPGTMRNGIILKSVNLGIENYNIKKILEEKTGLKVNIKNDTKCALIGEYKFGTCKKYQNVLFLTLGTGIGGGYIYKGEIMAGSEFDGFEIGHMVIKENGIKCNCGKNGCFEKYASILVLKNKVIERLNLSYDISGIELREIMKNRKNKIADIIDEYTNYLSIGISNLINIFEPDAIVIGGGFARYDTMLMTPLKEKLLNSNLLFNKRKDIIIQPAELGNDAGIIGASCI